MPRKMLNVAAQRSCIGQSQSLSYATFIAKKNRARCNHASFTCASWQAAIARFLTVLVLHLPTVGRAGQAALPQSVAIVAVARASSP